MLLDDADCCVGLAVSGYGFRLGTQLRAHAGLVGAHIYESHTSSCTYGPNCDICGYIRPCMIISCPASVHMYMYARVRLLRIRDRPGPRRLLWWQSLPHLILYSTCLSSCIFIRERGSWSLLASFISSLYYNYLGSLVNSIQKWFEPKSRQTNFISEEVQEDEELKELSTSMDVLLNRLEERANFKKDRQPLQDSMNTSRNSSLVVHKSALTQEKDLQPQPTYTG
jgi:hypothetical protein